MISRLARLALAGTLALAAAAHAGDSAIKAKGADVAVAGTAANGVTAPTPDPRIDGLTPFEPRVFRFGSGVAFVSYAPDENRAGLVHVVTIVARDSDGLAAPLRFVSHLAPGQTAAILVADPDADKAGVETPALDIAYDGGSVTVRSNMSAQVGG